jgi:hypothetical protein
VVQMMFNNALAQMRADGDGGACLWPSGACNTEVGTSSRDRLSEEPTSVSALHVVAFWQRTCAVTNSANIHFSAVGFSSGTMLY